ncbi:MAG: SUMF1/EgtB/PvdO family nonheme iron enzyme [Candidatus Eisenbacteria sp.]|nr:SUMF1/EgtB/PvdO family nonheme iron enzyme [Candidatus Eisenbacteria bacterium]
MDSGKLFFLVSAIFLACLGPLGCGEQDLYRPPESPFAIVGHVSMPSEAQDVDILGNYAYVAAGQAGLLVVDITNPANPELILWHDTKKFAESIRVARMYDPDGSPRDIALPIDGTEGITPFDITYVPDSLIYLNQGTGAYDGQDLCIVAPEFMTDPFRVYLADSWRGIRVLFTDPETPGVLQEKGVSRTYGYTRALEVIGNTAYVADDEMGITVLDVTRSITDAFVILGNLDTPGSAVDVELEGDYLYIADEEGGLQIMEIQEDKLVELVGSLALAGDCIAIEVANETAFLAAEDAGLHVVDVRDPYHPVDLGSVITSYAVGVAVGENNIVCIADRYDGLVVFRGPELPTDFEPPAAVSDLAVLVTDPEAVCLRLSWTAPGDDGIEGKAALYDIRWSDAQLVDSTWAAAQQIIRRPMPQDAGTLQRCEIGPLPWQEVYYLALRSQDDSGNWSEISNVVVTWPVRSSLLQPTVTPLVGPPGTEFTFDVTYTDTEGTPPVSHEVIIDGSRFEMQPVDSTASYVEGVLYRYERTLEYGTHEYSFVFDNGFGLVIRSPGTDAPDVQRDDPLAFSMVPIDLAGGVTFTMGSPASELGREAAEVQHTVNLTRSFEISATEVHQYLYEVLMDTNPSHRPGSSRPVDGVTWYEALEFCNRLSARDGREPAYEISAETYDPHGRLLYALVSWNLDADGYRLPTEAEWEYACRAGSETSLSNGDVTQEHCEFDELLDAVGWYCGNADLGLGPKTRSIALKEPNAFGLYDMHGNVWEWCWDRYADYSEIPVTIDPTGPEGDEVWPQRVRRGGSWYYYARDCRSASRDAFWPGSPDNTLGFRIARNAD